MFDNLKIGTRLIGGFASVIAIFMAVMLSLGIQLAQVEKDSDQIKDKTLPFILAMDEMALSVSQMQQFITGFLQSGATSGERKDIAAGVVSRRLM